MKKKRQKSMPKVRTHLYMGLICMHEMSPVLAQAVCDDQYIVSCYVCVVYVYV